MPDIYTNIATADEAAVAPLIGILETRAADPSQVEMRRAYFASLNLPADACVVEIGCGSGPVARALASLPGVAEVVGVDPSPIFVAAATQRGAHLPNLRFVEGDARNLPLEDGAYDAAVFHTTLSHVVGVEAALTEAWRVLRPGGRLAVFDGDYASATCAVGSDDPLQACLDAAMNALVHDRWIVRRLSALASAAGFHDGLLRIHGYLDAPVSSPYLTMLIDRGARTLSAAGRISPETAQALIAEARRRSDAGEFYGHITYGNIVATKPSA